MTKTISLGDVIKKGELEIHNSLRAPLNSRQRADSQGQYPYYGATGQMDSIDNYKFDGLHVLVAEDGTVYGSNGICPMIQRVSGKFWVSNHAHVLKCRDDIDTKYLALALEGSDVRPNITGAVQLKLSKDNLLKIKIFWPERNERERILNTIDPIDAKIEQNNNMSDNLERMAQSLFRKYFIDNPESQNWKSTSIADERILEIIKPKIEKFIGSKDYIATANVSDHSVVGKLEEITYDKRPSRANMQPTIGSIWFSKMTGEHKALIVDEFDRQMIERSILSTGFLGLKPKEKYLYYIWSYINSDIFAYKKDSLATGAVMVALNNGAFSKININIPSDDLLDAFNLQVSDLYKQISSKYRESQTLMTMRNSILPRLMSGDVSI